MNPHLWYEMHIDQSTWLEGHLAAPWPGPPATSTSLFTFRTEGENLLIIYQLTPTSTAGKQNIL